jgi:hypothetical protein
LSGGIVPIDLFTVLGIPFLDEDYIHISVSIATLASLNEFKIMLDCGDGSFTENFYYYTVRVSDIQQATANTLTQLGAAQLADQRATIDEETAAASKKGNLNAVAGNQTTPGDGQWADIVFPINALTRVGSDNTKNLHTVIKVQYLFNVNAATNISLAAGTIIGTYSPDVGDTGIPYMYWKRARCSITGALSNPSPMMRYGVNPRRSFVTVNCGTSYPDSQMDTWDIFRQGGSLSKKLHIGSIPIATGTFTDNYSDDAIENNDEMDNSNFEPFPTIGPAITANSASVVGTTMVVVFPSASASPIAAGTLSQIAALLPGNLINIGQQVFTLWTRPTFISSTSSTQTWLFQLVENAGTQTNPAVSIAEPAIANQMHPYVWGPDSNGVLFSVGDPLRPGVLSRTNPQNPDSCDEKNADELCAPSEPLQNGELLGGVSCVASTSRWWVGYPQQNEVTPYRWVEIPVGRGLAAPFGICSNGQSVFFWAKDGIYRHSLGAGESLTDADLYNLFPHEGVISPPSIVLLSGQTVYAPNYKYASNFHLAVAGNFLFADYIDTGINWRTLVLDLRTGGWSVDATTPITTVHAIPTSAIGSTTGLSAPAPQLFFGGYDGGIYTEASTGGTESVLWIAATRADTMGDLRADKQFGDTFLDLLAAGGNVTVTPVLDGALFSPATSITGGQTSRSTALVNLSGEQLARNLGLLLSGTDVGAQTKLYAWQPSYIVKPEDTGNRFGDWDDCGTPGAKFFQGFVIHCDTDGIAKNISIRNADTNTIEQTFTITASGEQELAFSFTTPFVAHLVREEPDAVSWKKYSITWVFQPTPETVTNWITQPTSHGMLGYQHVKEARCFVNAPSAVTFSITVDGTPYTYPIPATIGFTRVTIPFGPWKGRVFQYGATSAAGFQMVEEEFCVLAKAWGDSGPYVPVKLMGGKMVPLATI